jgi:hypothetical protein
MARNGQRIEQVFKITLDSPSSSTCINQWRISACFSLSSHTRKGEECFMALKPIATRCSCSHPCSSPASAYFARLVALTRRSLSFRSVRTLDPANLLASRREHCGPSQAFALDSGRPSCLLCTSALFASLSPSHNSFAPSSLLCFAAANSANQVVDVNRIYMLLFVLLCLSPVFHNRRLPLLARPIKLVSIKLRTLLFVRSLHKTICTFTCCRTCRTSGFRRSSRRSNIKPTSFAPSFDDRHFRNTSFFALNHDSFFAFKPESSLSLSNTRSITLTWTKQTNAFPPFINLSLSLWQTHSLTVSDTFFF